MRTPMCLVLVLGFAVAAEAGDIPADLAQAAIVNYPDWLRCKIMWGDPHVNPDVPLSEDATRGWIQASTAKLAAAGPLLAVVVYSRDRLSPEGKVFLNQGDGWRPAAFQGTTSYVLSFGSSTANPDVDVVFNDLDHDGTVEVVIYWRTRESKHGRHPAGVVVLAFRSGGLVPLTPVEFRPPTPGNRERDCPVEEGSLAPAPSMWSDSGVGFVDLDGNDSLALLIYPDRKDVIDPDNGVRYTVPSTGTRVYRLTNGVYSFQYETPVGISGTPPIAAAIKPLSVPINELRAVGESARAANGGAPGGGVAVGNSDDSRAVTLFIMPPASLTLDDLDWNSAGLGDFKVTSTADLGTKPAPRPPDADVPGWQPWQNAGQPVFIEDVAAKEVGAFKQDDKDPVIYVGLTARLRCATPYREVRFSKKALFSWAWEQWQKGAGDQKLKGCLPEGNHQRCFTPLHIPVKANLTGNHGFAMGEAILWVETKEAAASSAGAPGTATAVRPTPGPTPEVKRNQ